MQSNAAPWSANPITRAYFYSIFTCIYHASLLLLYFCMISRYSLKSALFSAWIIHASSIFCVNITLQSKVSSIFGVHHPRELYFCMNITLHFYFGSIFGVHHPRELYFSVNITLHFYFGSIFGVHHPRELYFCVNITLYIYNSSIFCVHQSRELYFCVHSTLHFHFCSFFYVHHSRELISACISRYIFTQSYVYAHQTNIMLIVEFDYSDWVNIFKYFGTIETEFSNILVP